MLGRRLISGVLQHQSRFTSPSTKTNILYSISNCSKPSPFFSKRYFSHNNKDDSLSDKKPNIKETENEVIIETEQEIDEETLAKQERIRKEVARRVAAQAAKIQSEQSHQNTEQSSTILSEQNTEERQQNEDQQDDLNQNLGQTKVIYSAFAAGLLLMAGITVYQSPFWHDGFTMFNPPANPQSILGDIYSDHRDLIESGSTEFNSLVPPHSVQIAEQFIKIMNKEDSMSLYIPILEKSSQSLIASGNIDITKEGKLFRVRNFYIDAVNGFHFDIDIPDFKYDTTNPKYTQML